jgi:hypothetical protein
VYIPRAALEVTAKDQNGKVIHSERRKYDNWNLWFSKGKKVSLRLWDITATTNVNQGLEPGVTDESPQVILLDNDVTSVDIEAKFLFEHEPDHWETIVTETKTVTVNSSSRYYQD